MSNLLWARFACSMLLLLSTLIGAPAISQVSTGAVCETIFKRPSYPTRQRFCVVGELVPDAYLPGVSYPCEDMEVDHLVSLRYAHRNGLCDAESLRRLANDPDNLRLTHWRTNRSKGTLSPEEFATKRLSPEAADEIIRHAAQLRKSYALPSLAISPDIRLRWLVEERDALSSRNAQLIANTKVLRNQQVIYRGRKLDAAQAVSFHASRVTRRITVSSLRNFTSMAAEALPFVGVGVIVGVTALEINDACEALKDVHELNLAFNPAEIPSDDVVTVCSLEVPSRDELLASLKSSPEAAWSMAKENVPNLPDIASIEIDWSAYLSMVKSGAEWIIEETNASSRVIYDAVMETWGGFEFKLLWQ